MLHPIPTPWFRYERAIHHWKIALDKELNLADPVVIESLIFCLQEFGVDMEGLTVVDISNLLLGDPGHLFDLNDLLIKKEDIEEEEEGPKPDFNRFDTAAWYASTNAGAINYSMKQILSSIKVNNWTSMTDEERNTQEQKKKERKAIKLAKQNWAANSRAMAERIRLGQIDALKVYDQGL